MNNRGAKNVTMPDPAQDTAIEITPKPRASSVPIPRIVAEINRVASRVRDRNKKEEEDIEKFWKTTHQRRRQNLRIFRLYGRIHTLILTILSSMDAFAQYVTRSC